MKAPDIPWESWQLDHAIIWNLTVLTQRKEEISLLNHLLQTKILLILWKESCLVNEM